MSGGTRMITLAEFEGNLSYGSWTGYLPAAATIAIRYLGASGTAYVGGAIDIWRVAEGG